MVHSSAGVFHVTFSFSFYMMTTNLFLVESVLTEWGEVKGECSLDSAQPKTVNAAQLNVGTGADPDLVNSNQICMLENEV